MRGRLSRRLPLWCTYALVLVMCAGCANAGAISSPTARRGLSAQQSAAANAVDAYLSKEAQEHRFSGAVLIEQDGTVLLSRGYGMADWQQRVPNTPQTQFRIASLTKQFTAMAILLLQHAGKLSVDDPICRFIAPCPAPWQAITIAEVLSHTSGIPDLADGDIADYTRPLMPSQLLALIAAKPLDFTPGSQFRYSSAGYNVLGVVIEHASGLPYATYLRQAIFAPLHMDHSGYDVNHPALPAHATGYSTWQQPADFFDITLPFAAGGLASTVEDLARWDQALAAGTLLPAAALAQLFAPRAVLCPTAGHGCPAGFTRLGYGFGWYVGQDTLGTVEYHVGDLLGYKSLLARYPDRRLTIIALSNLESTDTGALQRDLEKLLASA
jgi:CubicO group peptidase (beta-lactamase class C family)